MAQHAADHGYNGDLAQAPPPTGSSPPHSSTSHSKGSGGGGGCSNATCSGLDVSGRRRHQKSKMLIGIHINCCGAHTGQPGAAPNKGKLHEPTCVDVPPLPPPSIFSTTVPLKGWALTITASNRSILGGAGPTVHTCFSQCHPMAKINLTREKGDDKRQDHLHVSVYVPMQDCRVHRKQFTDGLHAQLSIGTTTGKIRGKVLIKPIGSLIGWHQGVSKDSNLLLAGDFRCISNCGNTFDE